MDDFETRHVSLPLIHYWPLDLAMHPSLGRFPHNIGEQKVESGTGYEERYTAAIDGKSKRWFFHHQGPILTGIGVSALQSEYRRMLHLKQETENVISMLEGHLKRLGRL